MLRRTEEPAATDGPEHAPAQRRRWPTVTLAVLAVLLAGLAVFRLVGADGIALTYAMLAITPYAVAAGIVLAAVAFLLRRRLLGIAVLLVSLVLAAPLVPRLLPDVQPAAGGAEVRIMSANLFKGAADARALVDLVRSDEVDVLNLLELTQPEVSALDQAGLAQLLPNRVFDPRPGASGSGVASRYPLRQVALMPETPMAEPSVVVDLPGRLDLEDVAVHSLSAIAGPISRWRADLADLPPATPNGQVRVLAGDFNSTLDHAAFRAVVDRGYGDAGELTGNGLVPTWSSFPLGLPVTIDHILVDSRCAVREYAVRDLPGSDHRAVFARLVLP